MSQSTEQRKIEARTSETDKIKYLEIGRELSDLKNELTDRLGYIKHTLETFVSDCEGVSNSENNFHVGKESVQPLVHLKAAASEIFNNVNTNDPKAFHQVMDFEPFVQHINHMKEENVRIRQLTSHLNIILDGITKLTEQQRKQKANGNGNESTSSLSTIGSEPSVLEFSLFENRGMNVITSSPLSEDARANEQPEA